MNAFDYLIHCSPMLPHKDQLLIPTAPFTPLRHCVTSQSTLYLPLRLRVTKSMPEVREIEKMGLPQLRYASRSPPGEATNEDAVINGIIEGHPQLDRNFSVLSLMGIALCMSNSWFGISASMITGISSGGTVLIIYGSIWITLVSMAVGASLSELASAMPNAGGQYIWVGELAPRRCAKFLSFLAGWLGYAGAIFASASVVLSLSQAILGMWQLSHPSL